LVCHYPELDWISKTSDTLGSPRAITKADGIVRARHDYLPFGEELYATVGNRTTGQSFDQGSNPVDSTRQKFTSKERDIETGLDYFGARYYSRIQGRFTGVDPIKLTTGRLLDPQRLNLYEYCRNNPLKYIDPDGEDLVLANAAARARARQVLAPGLTAAERRNIRISRNMVTLLNPRAIDMESASPAYRYLSQVIGSDTKFQYYAVGPGQTLTTTDGITLSYKDVIRAGGLATGEPGDAVRNVIIPIGGADPLKGLPAGSGNMTPDPEDVILAHELFGHGLDNDAVEVENEYRRTRNPALPERSGEDHQYDTTVTGTPEVLDTDATPMATEIPMRPLVPLIPVPPPPKNPRE
jgi:RHS repeat-associated protein